MSRIMIGDGNSVGYAAMHSGKLTHGGREVHGILGFLGSLKRIMTRFPDHNPLVLWDGKADFRYEVYPQYKDRAGKSPESDAVRESWSEQREDLKQAITALGITQMIHPGFEADDIAHHLTMNARKKGVEVLLVTGDRDWLAMLGENVRWCDHRSDKLITWQDFHQETGFRTVEAFIEAKIIEGDASDTIPGLGGVGSKTALEWINTYGSIHELIRLLDAGGFKGKKSAAIKRLESNEPFTYRQREYPGMRDTLQRNTKLIDLRHAPPLDAAGMQITRGEYNPAAFEAFCQDRLFNSILRKWDIFMKPFSELQAKRLSK